MSGEQTRKTRAIVFWNQPAKKKGIPLERKPTGDGQGGGCEGAEEPSAKAGTKIAGGSVPSKG